MISSDAVIVKIYSAYYITSNSLGGNGEVSGVNSPLLEQSPVDNPISGESCSEHIE